MNTRTPRSGGLKPPPQTTKSDCKSPLLALLFALAPFAEAAPRMSADYSIATETADAGGRRSTSAHYTHDGSGGQLGGISTVASPAETAKHGYLGQLYEVTGLLVGSASSNVNETATLQLAAWEVLDDASLLVVSAASVSWAVVSGPITGITAGGLATAGAVYQNTAASVQGTLGAFNDTHNLTVIETIADNFGAYAGDTLGDAWQVLYFGQPPNANAAPLIDPDGDGQTNLFEHTAGLVPTDAASRFALTIAPVPGQPGQKKIVFSPLVLTGGRAYAVEFRLDLATGPWVPLTGTTQSDMGSERTVTDLNATDARKFYRVEIATP